MAEHTSSYRILFRDIDSMGVLYYARYLALFEMGRVEWMRDEGVRYRDLEDCEGVILPVTSASCEYHASLRYDDIAKVRTRMTKMSGARVCWAFQIENGETGELCATGKVDLGCIHRETHRPTRIPSKLFALAGKASLFQE
ncbi:MAG: acyl-CoA thioesterase [Planctomycetes bacterium]|jgi:acyl-CoA thioester hydrolase|nr:acyl-CoA thioesterase [Planctomycetota bacterium]MBT4029532.1 acyl-CoA thioesterase [Planctomycetota bacterium]MBT4560598.1 acyl-CoA thioesterase [Planctomycetota bacterium]MBT5101842.1 acyl-CoA thioesterase [Planctomycetota bacterium]MBT5119170.1 acyl-CoA thioesterase [Planctomycetota bacterium]